MSGSVSDETEFGLAPASSKSFMISWLFAINSGGGAQNSPCPPSRASSLFNSTSAPASTSAVASLASSFHVDESVATRASWLFFGGKTEGTFAF